MNTKACKVHWQMIMFLAFKAHNFTDSNVNDLAHFDTFEVEYIPEEIKKIIGSKILLYIFIE